MTIPQLIAVAELCAEARSEAIHDAAISNRAAQMEKRPWVRFLADLAPKNAPAAPAAIDADTSDPSSPFYMPDDLE